MKALSKCNVTVELTNFTGANKPLWDGSKEGRGWMSCRFGSLHVQMDVSLGYHEARLAADEVVDGEENGLGMEAQAMKGELNVN
jgi:hypothetical protein